jgi:hypothetical protein
VQEYTLAIATYSYIDLILNEEMYVVVMKSKNCLSLLASEVTPILRNEICIPNMTQAGSERTGYNTDEGVGDRETDVECSDVSSSIDDGTVTNDDDSSSDGSLYTCHRRGESKGRRTLQRKNTAAATSGDNTECSTDEHSRETAMAKGECSTRNRKRAASVPPRGYESMQQKKIVSALFGDAAWTFPPSFDLRCSGVPLLSIGGGQGE